LHCPLQGVLKRIRSRKSLNALAKRLRTGKPCAFAMPEGKAEGGRRVGSRLREMDGSGKGLSGMARLLIALHGLGADPGK
jgi:hypothetical protein